MTVADNESTKRRDTGHRAPVQRDTQASVSGAEQVNEKSARHLAAVSLAASADLSCDTRQ